MSARHFQPDGRISPLLNVVAAALPAGTVAYAVGGTVRDTLLGRPIHDLDIALNGDAVGIGRTLANGVNGHFVELDKVDLVARIVLAGPSSVGHIDVASLQGDLASDLRRRDFTINALAAPLLGGPVTDVTGGVVDLDRRVVRMTNEHVFDEDPLRLVRAARIASELAFQIDEGTAGAIRVKAELATKPAGERVRDELARIFALSDTYAGLRLLDDLRLLEGLLPEVTLGRGVTQPLDWHVYDVFEHNLRAVEALEIMLAASRTPHAADFLREGVWRDFSWSEGKLRAYLAEELSEGRTRAQLLKLAALLHDVGKPQTRTTDENGRVRFLGHAELGAGIARTVMKRLRFSASEITFVTRLVEHHLRPVQLSGVGEVPSRRALYRFYSALGDAFPGVLFLSLADAAASRGPRMTSANWARHVAYMNSLLMRSQMEEGILDPPRLVDGRDVMRRLGLPAGPAIGKLLGALREAQAAGEVSDVDSAWVFLEQLAATEVAAEAIDEQ